MRETLHQLSLALALPITVAAVWIVRGDPAGVHATQTATAYRAELADLPLPTPQRLRAPREASDWLGVHRQSEDPIARRRRAALLDLAAPKPVALAVEAGSEQARVVAPSPRDGQPSLTGAPALAAPDALPTVSTPLLVASRAAAVPARVDTPESDAGAAVEAPEPDPDADAAAGASTASEKTAVARAETPAAPARSFAVLSAVPADRPSSAKPAPGVAGVRASALPLPERASGPLSSSPISSGPISPIHASRSPSVVVPSRGAGSVAAADSHETSQRGAGRSSSEKSWREEFAAALPSPALAYATRAASEPVDLSLDRDEWKDSLLHTLLPATSVTPLPAQWLAAADPIADTPASYVAMAPHTLPDLARVSPEVFAGLLHAEDGAASPAAFSNSRLFPPIFTLLAIPEPASALLLGAALAALAAPRRRGRRG